MANEKTLDILKPKSREISTQNLRRMERQASPETAGLVL